MHNIINTFMQNTSMATNNKRIIQINFHRGKIHRTIIVAARKNRHRHQLIWAAIRFVTVMVCVLLCAFTFCYHSLLFCCLFFILWIIDCLFPICFAENKFTNHAFVRICRFFSPLSNGPVALSNRN